MRALLNATRQFFAPPADEGALDAPPEADDVMGGFWGNTINWLTCDMGSGVYKVYGFKPFSQRPRVGWLIEAPMERSTIWFKIARIEWKSDPQDMFFAELEPVYQEMKT